MAYTVVPSYRGLATGEQAVRLASGEMVAIAVRSVRNDNGSGTTYFATARWVGPRGETKQCPNRRPVETKASANVSADLVATHGPDAFAREMLLMVLGEEPGAHVAAPVDLDAHAAVADRLPAEGVFTPENDQAPLLPVPVSDRLNASITHAIDVAKASGFHSPAGLL
jgi:hypothetical protein